MPFKNQTFQESPGSPESPDNPESQIACSFSDIYDNVMKAGRIMEKSRKTGLAKPACHTPSVNWEWYTNYTQNILLAGFPITTWGTAAFTPVGPLPSVTFGDHFRGHGTNSGQFVLFYSSQRRGPSTPRKASSSSSSSSSPPDGLIHYQRAYVFSM